MLHRRITLADEEFAQWRAGVPRPDVIGRFASRVPAEHAGNHPRSPVLGVGTGGFGKAYADRFDGTGAPARKIRTMRSC
jgi:hypothetical protein